MIRQGPDSRLGVYDALAVFSFPGIPAKHLLPFGGNWRDRINSLVVLCITETVCHCRKKAVTLRQISTIMEFQHIVSNPKILGGKPVLRGSRISIELVLEWMSSGATIPDILQKYPHLTAEGIKEALLYASRSIAHETVIEVQTSEA